MQKRNSMKFTTGVEKLEGRELQAMFHGGAVGLNPQPLPPAEAGRMLNPQPLPPSLGHSRGIIIIGG